MDEAMNTALKNAQEFCDAEDKSTEFMIQYMCDAAQTVDPSLDYLDAHDIVMEYLIND